VHVDEFGVTLLLHLSHAKKLQTSYIDILNINVFTIPWVLKEMGEDS